MTEPHPIFHFTRVEHLTTIIEHGLLSDALAANHLQIEVGNRGIKAQRARRPVPIEPGGLVGDYVPFYFAPRSPMMYAIHRGNVPTYGQGCGRLVYLVSSLERLWGAGFEPLGTDRNAVLDIAAFHREPQAIIDGVDWPLMSATYWSNTPDDPERRERRQAECLVHQRVPWKLIDSVVVKSKAIGDEVAEALAKLGDHVTKVFVRPSMYF